MIIVLWIGGIWANITGSWEKHILITAFTLIIVKSWVFITRALSKTIPTVATRVTPGHVMSTHVSNLLSKEILTLLITFCIEVIELC